MKESKALEIRNILEIKELKERVVNHLNVLIIGHRKYAQHGILNIESIAEYFNSDEFNHKGIKYEINTSVYSHYTGEGETFIRTCCINLEIKMYGKVLCFDYNVPSSMFSW